MGRMTRRGSNVVVRVVVPRAILRDDQKRQLKDTLSLLNLRVVLNLNRMLFMGLARWLDDLFFYHSVRALPSSDVKPPGHRHIPRNHQPTLQAVRML